MKGSITASTPILRLLGAAGAAVLVHGYHLGSDDAEIYVPAIKKAADPALYPFGAEFFQTHAHLSWFPDLVGGFVRITGLPADWAILLCHVTGVFLLLLAAWRLACGCFESRAARWGGVLLLAAAFSTPVAGTALVIMDPYVTARSLSTPGALFAVAEYVSGRRARAWGWLLFTALVHPQMAAYGAVLLGGREWAERRQRTPAPVVVSASWVGWSLPFVFALEPVQGPAREALLSRTYFFVSEWAWYEWLGVIAPLALLWWFSAAGPRRATPASSRLARMLVLLGLLATAGGLLLITSARLENYTRLQPMRAFHLIYLILFVLIGGLLGEYALRGQAWRWLAFFASLAVMMYGASRASYPFSPHLELPGAPTANPWIDTFEWIRRNTPRDAVFAMDPNYMAVPEDDQHGFRAIAERSALADNVKDSGAVSLFPQLAEDWKSQVIAQTGWRHFARSDFEKLARAYPVTWIVTSHPAPAGLVCPYSNAKLAVCRINGG